MVSGLIFKSLIHFEFVCIWCELMAQFHCYACSCLVFPTQFIEETVISPLYNLSSFLVILLTIYIWVYFWAIFLFHWTMCLFLCQCCTLLIAMFCPFKNWLCFLLIEFFWEFFMYSGYLTIQRYYLKIFSPVFLLKNVGQKCVVHHYESRSHKINFCQILFYKIIFLKIKIFN